MMGNDTRSVTIEADLSEFMVNDKKVLIGYVSGRALLKSKGDIPNKANPREFMGDGNKFYPIMRKSISDKPKTFHVRNIGIHVSAKDYRRNDDGTYTIYFRGNEGIFNGNHTKNIQIKYGQRNSMVLLVVHFDIPKEDLIDISISKNSSTPTKEISRGERLGRYEWIKEILADYDIGYKESDMSDLKVDTILHLVGLFQIDEKTSEFVYKDNLKFQKYLRRKGNVLTKYNNRKLELEKTRYILKDIVDLYDLIRSDEENIVLIKRTLNQTTWVTKGVITDSLMFNIINAINFALYVPNTHYPCLKNEYTVDRLQDLVIKAFPEIVNKLKKYEVAGYKLSEICRESNIYHEIQSTLLVTEKDKMKEK